MSFLELSALKKTYPDGTEAVRGIDLAVEEGELVVLLGPSGCGKTTTLRMIAGLETVTAGEVILAGRNVKGLRPSQRDVGFVFQFYALYPHLTVQENIAFPLKSVQVPRRQREKTIANVAARLGIEGLLERYPRQLSGGDQQRVGLARAMVRRPSIYLMDEPLGNLDADLRYALRELIRRQQLEMGVTTIYVTHDQEEAMSLADRIVVMDAGHIYQVGAPTEVYDNPANLFVANFVGSPGMNFVEGQVVVSEGACYFAREGEGPILRLERETRPGKVRLGIRPEYVHPDPEGPIRGKVVMDEFLGCFRCVHVETACGRIIMRIGVEKSSSMGKEVRLGFAPAQVRLFDAQTEWSL